MAAGTTMGRRGRETRPDRNDFAFGLLQPKWNYVFDMYMTFAGERLAFVDNGRVYLFDVVATH